MSDAGLDRVSIYTEARAWIDTPFVHQGHLKRVGTDCGGLVAGVGVELGAFPADAWTTIFREHAGYARTPSNGMLESICHLYFRPIAIDDAQAGDVVLMKFETEPQHVAILAPYLYGGLSMIHAHARVGRVTEHRYAPVWRSRVTEAFTYPGVL